MKELNLRYPKIVVKNHLTIKRQIIEKMGAGMMPEMMIQDELKSGELVNVIPNSKPIYSQIDIAVKRERNKKAWIEDILPMLIPRIEK
jgi:DNA-binding transcriptional LysR family regulator